MTMNGARMAVLVSVLGVLIAACSGSTTGTAQQGAAATAMTAAPIPAATSAPADFVAYPGVVMPEALRGVWIANVQRPGPSSGLWRLRITEHVMWLKNPVSASDADYFVTHTDRIDDKSFHQRAADDCPEITYQYTVTGDQLILTTTRPQPTSTDDVCGDGVVIMTTPFKRDS